MNIKDARGKEIAHSQDASVSRGFVYLDEGLEDPPYYDIDLETGEIREQFPTLSECVTYYVNRVKAGRNPF
jgi:hypothetical protein